MSVERSFEAWEEVQRHGQDLADRLAQGFNGLIHTHITPPSFPWPNPNKTIVFDVDFSSHNFKNGDFGLSIIDKTGLNGVSAIFDIGNKLGQVGVDFGNSLNGMVNQFFRRIPVPFRHEEQHRIDLTLVREDMLSATRSGMRMATKEDLELPTEQLGDFGCVANESCENGLGDEEVSWYNLRSTGLFGRPQGTINMTSTYDSRTNDIESSLLARGDLWRVEASHDSSTSRNNTSSLFLLQLGPVLFVRDSTLLLPVHLSKQHLLWYGYDRKNGMHSLCPAVWTKHRRWLLMSMICLNPLACSFVDLQFPNGQLTYVAGEGFTTSAFLPICGGLLQAQGQYPGDMRFSFSCKNKWGTRITPTLQWPEKSFSMGVVQALAWQRSGIMLRPTVQLSVCPSFGGTNPGLLAEVTHSVKEQLSLIGGCAFTTHPTAFASIAIGRSKWNGNNGSSGIVVKVETPLSNIGRPAFSVQLNSSIEF